MIKIPVRGMRDITPTQMALRNYLLSLIRQSAISAGYQEITTPAIEHLENLSSKDGGENEGLIFKIQKRGAEFESALENNEELSDSALRYDLTVPLARYYTANRENLPAPFKSLQIGSVWRAEAPQKGRFREFTQCDFDILGDDSNLAEVDIITTTLSALDKICTLTKLDGLTLRYNDRRFLLAAAKTAGFSPNDASVALISLDKRDKIGFDGASADLASRSFDKETIEKFISVFKDLPEENTINTFLQRLGESAPDEDVVKNLNDIIDAIRAHAPEHIKIVFDPTLVRGMGYYTGPIFECNIDGFSSSIAGGGRYDEMVEKFGGPATGACGFSIGFERLLSIFEERGFKAPTSAGSTAILLAKNLPSIRYAEVLAHASQLRNRGEIVSILPMARNLGHQISILEQNGFTTFEKVYE